MDDYWSHNLTNGYPGNKDSSQSLPLTDGQRFLCKVGSVQILDVMSYTIDPVYIVCPPVCRTKDFLLLYGLITVDYLLVIYTDKYGNLLETVLRCLLRESLLTDK